MNRQKKQLLLARLDKIAYRFLKKKEIRALIQIHEGVGKENGWVFETPLYRNSRLIQAWHRMSMDLSI
jgi:hypothetical protein